MAESKMDRSRYPSHPAQVRSARHHAEQVLRDWGVGDSTTDAVLYVAGELASNAVRHARTLQGREFGMTLRLLESIVRVELRDPDPTLPTEVAPGEDLEADGGRGLLIVERLASSWGSAPEVLGKTIWADIPLGITEAGADRATLCADGAS
ncbi:MULTISPECIES: ATP-binding protein [unclassified Streptomyces]|uniref:ATP-binding protein n=1 Tax=unclassified Streptomyces TaxID=2593676 RepID=UPI0033FBD07C